jgi:predicted O-linked N-acetylglucosamine transferase (SPINDLY family)
LVSPTFFVRQYGLIYQQNNWQVPLQAIQEKRTKRCLAGDIRYEPLTDTEETFVSELVANVAKGFNEPKAINYLLAAMLYRRADQLPLKYDRATVPNWFANEYLKFMFTCPNLFQTRGEADSYYQFIQGWVDYVHSNIFKNPDSQLWQNIALFFSQVANFIPLYFTTANLRDIYTKRAEIIEFSLKNRGCSIDCIFPARSPNRTKIRLGIISDHFAPQTETFATIPVFEHLNRNQFEIYLYALNTSGHQLEQYCQSRADKLVALPKDFASQVQTIRADDLDILFFGTNLTAINKPVDLASNPPFGEGTNYIFLFPDNHRNPPHGLLHRRPIYRAGC